MAVCLPSYHPNARPLLRPATGGRYEEERTTNGGAAARGTHSRRLFKPLRRITNEGAETGGAVDADDACRGARRDRSGGRRGKRRNVADQECRTRVVC